MCGIITVTRFDGKSPLPMFDKSYEAQKTRGQEGFGFVALNDGKIADYVRAETEEKILEIMKETVANEIIFHHRFPTSTDNLFEAAHPIKVSHESLKYDYYVLHNGVVFDDEYKLAHDALGFKYSTLLTYKYTVNDRLIEQEEKWNDSEALAIELAMDLDKEGEGVAVQGSIAFVVLQTDKEGKAISLKWGRNTQNPLVYRYQPHAFLSITSEGSGNKVKEHTLYEYDYALKTLAERPYQVGKKAYWETAGYYNSYDRDEELRDKELDKMFDKNGKFIQDLEVPIVGANPEYVIEDWEYYKELALERGFVLDAIEANAKAHKDTTELSNRLKEIDEELTELEEEGYVTRDLLN